MTAALIDITPPVSAKTPMFPGDTVFEATRSWAIGADCPVNVSRLVMSTHTGTHADAPLHYDAHGAAIDEVDVSSYIGPCAVVHLLDQAPAVSATALAAALDEIHAVAPERVLIRTYHRLPERWDPDFTAIGADAIDWLAARGCGLIGVDTPSLDPSTSKSMDAHNAVNRADMRILEGLRLDHVTPGIYELIAPPLKLQGLDAAPVRALLRTIKS